jgi:hypothetical protein
MVSSLEGSDWMAVVSVRGKQRHLRILAEQSSNILFSIPDDIWLSIFDAVSLAENAALTVSMSSIMSISAVCRYWRHLTRATPTLWSRIRIFVTPSSYHVSGPVALKTYLALSGEALLDVFIDGRYQAEDWFRFHKQCHMSHNIDEPYGVHVWKKRPSDEELLTYEVEKWQSHTSCYQWLDLLEERHQVNWKLLSHHTHRIRSFTMKMQTIESFSWSEDWGWQPPFPPNLRFGDETTLFPELINVDIACNGESSVDARIHCIALPSSKDRMPKLRSLTLRNADVGEVPLDRWPDEWDPVPMHGRLHARLSGHEQLTSLSLCPISLRLENSTIGLPAPTLRFPALKFLRIEDSRRDNGRWVHSYQPSSATIKSLFLQLYTPCLHAVDVRGAHPLQGFLAYLKSVSSDEMPCNLSSIQQLRLTGEVRRNTGLLRLVFSVMPEVRQASFHDQVCQHITGCGQLWSKLEDLSINYTKACNETVIRQFVLDQKASPGSPLCRVYILRQDIRQDQAPQAIRRWAERYGLVYNNWEWNRDAWPWTE